MKISRSYENYSRSYEKNDFFLLLFLTLIGFRSLCFFVFYFGGGGGAREVRSGERGGG